MSVRASRASSRAGAVDLGVIALLMAAALVGFAPTFGGASFVLAAAAGGVAGLGLAWLGARIAWSLLPLAAATVVTYGVLAGPIAFPDTTVAGFLPTLRTLRGLALGVVTSWKGLLTVAPPVDVFPELRVVPLIAALVTAVLAGSLALRARRPAWALLPPAVLLVGVIGLGTADVVLPLVQGLVFGAVALAWAAWRRAAGTSPPEAIGETTTGRRDVSRRLRQRRLRDAVVLLAAASAVTAAVFPLATPDGPRRVLRDVVVPPLDLREYPSPLAGYRSYVKDLEEEVLFTVTGLPEDGRVRLTTMDAYTGTVIDVAGGAPGTGSASGAFTPVGERIPGAEGLDAVPIEVEIRAYDDVWVPVAGETHAVRFEGERSEDIEGGLYANTATGAVLTTRGLREGDRYTVEATVPAAPDLDQVAGQPAAAVRLPQPDRLPDAVASLADTFAAGAATPYDQAVALRDALVTGGVFSDGLEGQPTSRAGHGAERLNTLLTGSQMVGDDEQFAVAFVLMARQLGLPARAVMGFHPEEPLPEGSTWEVRGTDVHAWAEVAFDGVGWVPFDVTPDEDQPPQDQDPRANSVPEPQVIQEPPPPEEPAEPPLQPVPDPAEAEQEEETEQDWTRFLPLLGFAAIPLALLLVPLLVIVLAKSVRRRRRRRAADPVLRVSGGWRELEDAAVDLGHSVAPSSTRRATALSLQEQYPGVGTITVAERADEVVWGTGEPTEADIAAFWSEIDEVLGTMSKTVGRRRWFRSRISRRSLARSRRPRGDRR